MRLEEFCRYAPEVLPLNAMAQKRPALKSKTLVYFFCKKNMQQKKQIAYSGDVHSIVNNSGPAR